MVNLLGNMIKESITRSNHDVMRYRINLAVHHELLLSRQLHEDDTEIGSTKIKRQKFTIFFTIGKFSNKGWEALHGGGCMSFFCESLFDGVSHFLFQHMNMIIVKHQVSDEVFNEPSSPG